MKTLLASLLLATSLTAAAASVTVNGNNNVYNITGAGQGTSPQIISLTGTNLTLQFPNVTGTVSGISGAIPANGPDGHVNGANFVITGANNMSGITDQTTLFLAGAFLGPTQPATAPAALNFGAGGPLGISFASLSPQLGQVFFIGDGHTGTGSGAVQSFVAPAGATRLFLGFVDSCGGASTGPGCYGDNLGSLNVTYTIATAPVPELPTFAMFALGVMLIIIARRKKS